MLGAVFGDIAGSVYEFANTHDYDFPLLCRGSEPTDDTYMTLAVAKALCRTYGEDDNVIRKALTEDMHQIGRMYPRAGYGGMFSGWLRDRNPQPYNSFGNGSAMRVSPAGWLYPTMEETLHAAELSAEVTHNHPEGIKGAKAIAAAVYLARCGASKQQIKAYITGHIGYDLSRTLDEIRPDYRFNATCQKSVPEAVTAFLEGENYEDVIRKAITLGGDSDTIACMAGGIAEAYYGMPDHFRKEVMKRLDPEMKEIIADFETCRRLHPEKPSLPE